MKTKLTILALALVSLTAVAQTNTPGGTFFNTVGQYFTSFNTNLAGTFQAKTTLWTGVDSVQGGNSSLVNEIGLSYAIYGPLSLESITRDGGVAGTLVSQQVGFGANFVLIDTRLTAYADAGYRLDSPSTVKFRDNLYGEVGLRIAKALTEHTFAWVGLGVKVPQKEEVFEGGVGFTF